MNTAKPISVKNLTDEEMRKKYADRVRLGKTLSDRNSGSWRNRFENRQKPIRCTSSHKIGSQDSRGPEYWRG